MVKAAIFILTQNNIERKVYLKTSLYFLCKNFNSLYKYPIVIFHEGDYDIRSQQEIISGVREECRNLISFKELDKNDFVVPDFIDKEIMNKSVESKPVPYWRNVRYRLMCRWWIIHFWKYTEDYEYVMRLDDDSLIEEKISEDLFDIAKTKEYVFVSNFIHIDCGVCNYGFKELLDELYPSKKEIITKLFTDAKLQDNNEHFKKFKTTYEIVNKKPLESNEINLSMPIMYYNNFFVTETAFWKREDVKELINRIDKSGYIFYYRLGDAPIMSLIVLLLVPNKCSRTIFKYSKRLQREVFIDDENKLHSFMPKLYSQSSCITQR